MHTQQRCTVFALAYIVTPVPRSGTSNSEKDALPFAKSSAFTFTLTFLSLFP